MNKLFSILLAFSLMVPPSLAAEGASQQFLENPDAEKKGSMAKTLMVMATSTFGAAMPVGCVAGVGMVPSALVFSAGSIIFLIGEMSAGKSRNSSLKKRAEDLKLSQEKVTAGGSNQRAALEEALKEQKDLLAFIEKRSGHMGLVKIAYMAAAGVAIGEALGFVITTINCAGLPAASLPWVAALVTAYQIMLGVATGETLAALLGPVIVGVGAVFIPVSAIPVTRAALFTAAAMAAGSVASDLNEKKRVVKGNVDMLESALKQFDEETATSDSSNLAGADESSRAFQTEIARANTGTAVSTGSTAAANIANLPGADASSAAFANRVCATGSGDSVKLGSDCSNPMHLKTSGIFSDIPELQAAASNSVQTANSMAAGGSIGGANVSEASLASSAGRIKEINDGLMKRLNEKLAREGKPKVDLDAEAKKAMDGMTASIMGEINKGGAPLLASLGPALGATPPVAERSAGDSKPSLEKGNSPAPLQAAFPSQPLPGVIDATVTGKPSEFTATNAQPDQLENYEVNTQDISKDKESSIWEQVTTRYQMNYGRFFEREKPEVVQP